MQFVVRWSPSHKITMANVTSSMWRRGQFNNIIPKKSCMDTTLLICLSNLSLWSVWSGIWSPRHPADLLARETITLQHPKGNIKVLLVAGLTIALIVPNQCIVVVERTLYCICYGRKELTRSQHVVTRKPVKYKKIINSPLFTLGSI